MIAHLPPHPLSLAAAPAAFAALLAAAPHPAAPLLAVDRGVPGPLGDLLSQDLLRTVLTATIFLANLAGGVVVAVAIVRGLVTYAVDLVRQRGGEVPKEAIRLTLGRSLSLALEFQLGADILATALDPTREDLIILAAIVVLRTVLNYFLGRELEGAQQRERKAHQLAAQGQEPGRIGAQPEPVRQEA